MSDKTYERPTTVVVKGHELTGFLMTSFIGQHKSLEQGDDVMESNEGYFFFDDEDEEPDEEQMEEFDW